jgi:L-ornithine Nalpha-acyltransferase
MVMTDQATTRPVEVRARDLLIRLAETPAEVAASQELRFRVFCEEMDAKPSHEMAVVRREFDSYDEFCDHLLVFNEAMGQGSDSVVGSYRLMRRSAAARRGQFYSADEYDISVLLNHPGEIMELGRSCVERDHRSGAVMQLLWRGISEYVVHFDVDLMFGCASLPGIEPDPLNEPLSYLFHYHLAPVELRPRAVAERYLAMDRLAPDQFDAQSAMRQLPPLVRGYLRLGGYVGDGAVVDPDFGTTDVCVVVKTDLVTEKYYRHYIRSDPDKQQTA